MVNGNELGDVGFQYLGTPYSVMDCQAFVEKCLRDCGNNTNLTGSNAWYREVMAHGWVGTPEECTRQFGYIPKGAFIFIWAQDGKEPEKYKKDGIGNASHIGIVTMPRGEGAINSSYTRGCVCESKFAGKTIPNGGWNRIGLWDQVAYGIEPKPDPEPQPVTENAEVYASNGKPVNMRKFAGKTAALIDKVPCGETVEVLEYGDTWCKIRWRGKTGYMMTEFLRFEGQEELYCVIIHDLPILLAEEIANTYGGSITREE